MSLPNNIIRLESLDPENYSFVAVYREGQTIKVDLKNTIFEAKEKGNNWIGALADPDYFAQVRLSPPGFPEWPNELDFCPDTLLMKYPEIENQAYKVQAS